MNPHDWYVDHRVDFVTRTLEEAEERSFADHMRRCEGCADAVRQIERELAWLPMGVEPVSPRPGFRRQIVQSVLAESRPGWRRWFVPVSAAASLILATGVTLGGYLPARREARQLSVVLGGRNAELMALRDSLSVMHQASRVLHASIAMEGQQGGLLIFADERSHRWNVVMHGLPPAPPDQAYEFWFISADGMVRGATLVANPGQPAFLILEMPKTGGAVMGAALTLEHASNRSASPRGKELAHLML